MLKRTIADVDVRGKHVLMRVDFNVPLEGTVESGGVHIIDDRRIRLALDSIRNVLDRKGRLVLISHLGRPQGAGFEPDLSLLPCAQRLSELLQKEVVLAGDCLGPRAWTTVEGLRDGEVAMLENLRFHEGEILGDLDFAAELSELADVYVNEAFAASHRNHASLTALPGLLESQPRVAGLQLAREIRHLQHIVQESQRPFALVLGGTRVDDKLAPMLNLLDHLDAVLVGGTMATTLMAAEGRDVGSSMIDAEHLPIARQILDATGRRRARLMLPLDYVCVRNPENPADTRIFTNHIPPGWSVADLGPRTIVRYSSFLREAKTVFWTGPVGMWETPPLDVGTKMIALAITHASLLGQAQTVVAGASTALALERFGLHNSVTHVSTGGSATLALLQGRPLASIELLDNEFERRMEFPPRPSLYSRAGMVIRDPASRPLHASPSPPPG